MRHRGPAFFAALGAASLGLAAPPTAAAPARDAEPTAARLEQHVRYLADDGMAGRLPGTPGFAASAAYVAGQFRQAGLRPLLPEGWMQPVPLVRRTPNADGKGWLAIGAHRFAIGGDALGTISGEGAQSWRGQAVFVGHGLVSERLGIDDYAGVDVRGKAVIHLAAMPAGMSEADSDMLRQRRASFAVERGAVGVITVFDRRQYDQQWPDWRDGYAAPFDNWLMADGMPFRFQPLRFGAVLSPIAAQSLFEGSGETVDQLFAASAAGKKIAPFAVKPAVTIAASNQWRRYDSANVLGVLPGSDLALAKEFVLVTAHLDHIGTKPGKPGEDNIFNGALDNASGVAALIETARRLARSKPRRPILFVATTGEELDLLGSDYLAERGLPGGGKPVGVVNIDGGVPTYAFTEVSVFGGTHSTLGRLFERVAAKAGERVVPDGLAASDLFERTDHFSFARRGIPSVFLAMRADEQQKATYWSHVHQPNDDLTLPFNWTAGARFCALAAAYVAAIANADEAPAWYADSAFLAARGLKARTVPRPPH